MPHSSSAAKTLLKQLLPGDWLERRAIRQWYQLKQQSAPTVEQAISAIQQRWPQLEVGDEPLMDESPIFLLAAEWRSGSTLVQRVINSDPRVLLWGEPYADCNLIQSFADSLRIFTASYPPSYNFINAENFEESEADLSSRWIANLYPEMTALRAAHRQFFAKLFVEPAAQRGFTRWGIKEVRLDINQARYLHWLFPQAKFLFLYRNPYKAYRSCRTWRNLYIRWPEGGIDSAEAFGRQWKAMTEGFIEGCDSIGGRVIKYEDFCARTLPVAELADYLELDLQESVLDQRIGSQEKIEPVPQVELKRLQQAVEPLGSQLGYQPG